MAYNTILNREFRVKVSGLGFHQLVGWTMLVELIGEDMAIRALNRALECRMDKYTWKLRRGLKLDFYQK